MYSYKTSNKIFKKTSKKKSKSFLETIKSYKGFDSKEVEKGYYNSKKNQSNNNLLYASYSTSPKLYSLLDINYKINSRGTSLPIQYERLTDEQIKNFPLTYRNGWRKKNINIKIENDEEEKNNDNKGIIIKDNINNNNIDQSKNILNTNKNNISLSERKSRNKNEINENEDNYNNMNKNSINSFRLSQKIKIEGLKKNNLLETTKTRKKNDIYLPKGYLNYEKFIINPKLFKQKISNDPLISRLPDINLKEIIKKSNETDIFYIKTPSNKDNINIIKTSNYPNNMSSDIFNIKNDKISILKSGEKYLFNKPKISYTVSNESKSFWEPNPKIPTLYNHSSKEYNIIIPNVKNISNTKKNILENCDLKRNINIVNDYNPIYRQKCLSDYQNIIRVSSANVNNNYMENYKKCNNVFNRNSDICSCLCDIHRTYNNLCEKPFVNKI